MEGYVERICRGCRRILYYYTEEEANKAGTFGSHYCDSCHPDTKWRKSCTGRLAGCLAIPIVLFAIGFVIQIFQDLNWLGWTVLVIIVIGAGWFYYQRVESTKGPFKDGEEVEGGYKPPEVKDGKTENPEE